MVVSVRKTWIKIGVLLSFLVMVTVNALANILPLNGVPTGDVADRYSNLFTPAPLTFAIWGAIYLALAVYVIFQLLPAKHAGDADVQSMLEQIGKLFIFSSLLNAAWIFSWHYDRILLSVGIMALILVSLARIMWLLRTPHCSPKEELALRIPFGLYFGWITVATIANITTLLVQQGWQGLGISQPIWTSIMVLVGALIAGVTMYRNRSVAYGLAVVWAYAGILNRHLSAQWYNGQYTMVIVAASVAAGALVVMLAVTAIHMRKVATCKIPS